MNIIAMAFVVGGLILFALAVGAMTWLITASRRADDEQERSEAWDDMLATWDGLVVMVAEDA